MANGRGHPESSRKRCRCYRLLLLGLVATLATATERLAYAPLWTKEKKKVVVLGGGFAGLAVVRHLRRNFEVTLVDAKKYFEFIPGMVRPYSNPDLHRKLVVDYASVCKKMKVSWIWGAAEKLQGNEVVVQLNSSDQHRVAYDYCVVATGCDFGSLWAVSPTSGTRPIDRRYLEGRQKEIEKEYDQLTELADRGAHVAVIGAGFVGVEFATELKHYFPYLQISLASRSECCCPTMPKSARSYIQKYLDKHNITTYYQVEYPNEDAAANTLWTRFGRPCPERVFKSMGMRPHCSFLPPECLTEKGWVKMTPTLQIANGSEADLGAIDGKVFAIGSCIDQVPGVDPLPKNSFPAEEMAAHVARNIRRSARGKKMKPFYWPLLAGVSATSLGPKDGVLLLQRNISSGGMVALRGRAVVWVKEIIRWTKVDECKLGILGTLFWHFVH
ncbi:unnamed protein product [Durusdinium trenchii]|uniref:Apoptosis-inducing factor homolog A n=2 Tax=Durusdinium trenchii TaxID=1381693 RepID=A0ABP0MF67_9DINO